MDITFKISTKSINHFILLVQKLDKLKSFEIISQNLQCLSLTILIKDISHKIQLKLCKVISTIPDAEVNILNFFTTIYLDLTYSKFRNALCSLAKLNDTAPNNDSIVLSNLPYIEAVSNKGLTNLEVNLAISPIAVTIHQIQSNDFISEYNNLIRSEVYDRLSDTSKLEKVQRGEAQELCELLKAQRKGGGFTYKRFIISNLYLINDYSVIRRALKLYLGDGKTLEKAVTVTRRILKELEDNNKLIFFYSNEMIDEFLNSIK